MLVLVACDRPSHKRAMGPLFDQQLRALRRDRAARTGPALFLLERAFDDCLERIALMERPFGDALLIGCPDPAWPQRIAAATVQVAEPGPIFAREAGAKPLGETQLSLEPRSLDLICAIGTLDTVDDLPAMIHGLAFALRPGGLLIGAMAGGDTLPRLRSAMLAADRVAGAAAPHVHPRIEAAALSPLLEQAGLARPVVDIDRVRIAYNSFDDLVRDLRAMAATNLLKARPRTSLGRAALDAARADFAEASGKTVETIEILHFAAWKPDLRTGKSGR